MLTEKSSLMMTWVSANSLPIVSYFGTEAIILKTSLWWMAQRSLQVCRRQGLEKPRQSKTKKPNDFFRAFSFGLLLLLMWIFFMPKKDCIVHLWVQWLKKDTNCVFIEESKLFFKQLYWGCILCTIYLPIHGTAQFNTFSKFLELCNNHHNPVLEHFHHPKKLLCTYRQSISVTKRHPLLALSSHYMYLYI